MIYSVKNHKEFAKFDYVSTDKTPAGMLGNILIKDNEIGVVIQAHEDGDIRTDMWGNCSPGECSFATMEQITALRPKLLPHVALEDSLQGWEIEIITDTFKRCWGLQKLVIADSKEAIAELARQCGMRLKYVTLHLEQIKSLLWPLHASFTTPHSFVTTR